MSGSAESGNSEAPRVTHSDDPPSNELPRERAGPEAEAELEPVFSQQIVVVDHYMTRPVRTVDDTNSPLTGAALFQVPVMRIFGSTHTGQPSCLHVHKVPPSFSISSFFFLFVI